MRKGSGVWVWVCTASRKEKGPPRLLPAPQLNTTLNVQHQLHTAPTPVTTHHPMHNSPQVAHHSTSSLSSSGQITSSSACSAVKSHDDSKASNFVAFQLPPPAHFQKSRNGL